MHTDPRLDDLPVRPAPPSAPKASRGCRDFMRDWTRAAHSALEAQPLMAAISAGTPTERQYRAYLLQPYALVAALESSLGPWLPAAWAAERLVKSQWLLTDLRALGEPPARSPVARPPVVQSPAQAMGVMYVLEGATLGQQVIAKRLRAHELTWAGAQRFLQGYGADSGRRWQEFVARLDALPADDWLPAARAAAATFCAFQDVYGAYRDD